MKKKIILAFAALLFMAGISFAQVMEKEIEAEGVAAGDSLQSKDAALNRALRNAIEESVGVLVDSETLVRNSRLLDDKIYSEVKGYIKSYEIIADNRGAGGVYRIKVKASVALGALTKDIKALGIIKERLKYPRIVVLVDEYVDGAASAGQIAASEIEKIFMRNKFPVVNKEQLDIIKERDIALAYDNPTKAAILGQRHGAEVTVIGLATSDMTDASRPYGVSVFAYESNINLKAVKADNAQVLAIDEISNTERGSGRMPTANKAIKAASEKISVSFMKKLAEAWRDEIYNETNIQLICENATFDKSEGLKKALNEISGVKGINEKSFSRGILELDIRFFGNSDQLAVILGEIKNPRVEVMGKTPNRIDIRFN